MLMICSTEIDNTRIEYITNQDNEESISIVSVRNVGSSFSVPEEIEGHKIKVIGKKAFIGCRLLRQITIPAGIEEIHDYAFAQCYNLRTVIIMNNKIHFGNGIFTECNMIQDICLGYEEPDDISALLGTLIYRLKAEHILVDDSWGTESWYAKWDMELLAYLRQDDEEGYTDLVLCGEEDIQYSLEEYITKKRINKSALCLIRLMHNSMLTNENERVIKNYILSHIKGCRTDEAWQALISEFSNDINYFKLFADIGGINSDNIDGLLADMGEVSSEAKVFLIDYKKDNFSVADAFDVFSL